MSLFLIVVLPAFEPKVLGLRQAINAGRSESLVLLPTCRVDRLSRMLHHMKAIMHDLVLSQRELLLDSLDVRFMHIDCDRLDMWL